MVEETEVSQNSCSWRNAGELKLGGSGQATVTGSGDVAVFLFLIFVFLDFNFCPCWILLSTCTWEYKLLGLQYMYWEV